MDRIIKKNGGEGAAFPGFACTCCTQMLQFRACPADFSVRSHRIGHQAIFLNDG